jgi:catechol 2,3-dioxygenase-like lactoylglutathione lyase family enzyme
MSARKPSPPAPGPEAGRPSPPYFVSVAVVVSDRKKALDWYTKTLGLDVIANDGHWVTVGRKGRGGEIHLCQTTEYDPNGQLEPGNSGIMFRLPGKDFAASCGALKSRGVAFSQEPKKESWGWYASIRDPDGNEHMLAPEE